MLWLYILQEGEALIRIDNENANCVDDLNMEIEVK